MMAIRNLFGRNGKQNPVDPKENYIWSDNTMRFAIVRASVSDTRGKSYESFSPEIRCPGSLTLAPPYMDGMITLDDSIAWILSELQKFRNQYNDPSIQPKMITEKEPYTKTRIVADIQGDEAREAESKIETLLNQEVTA